MRAHPNETHNVFSNNFSVATLYHKYGNGNVRERTGYPNFRMDWQNQSCQPFPQLVEFLQSKISLIIQLAWTHVEATLSFGRNGIQEDAKFNRFQHFHKKILLFACEKHIAGLMTRNEISETGQALLQFGCDSTLFTISFVSYGSRNH